jgi:ribosomal protein S18 acetylase RimI-like enzyme
MTKDEIPAVARLAAKLVRMHHTIDPRRFFCVEPVEEGYAWFLSREMDDDDAFILVALRDEAIVGYTYATMESRNWNDLLDACGKLHDLYVDESARKEGVATALVEAMLSRLEAKGAPRVVLSSAFQNTVAQKLFERVGFRPTMIEMTRERQ